MTGSVSSGGTSGVGRITGAMCADVHLQAGPVAKPFVTHRACIWQWFCIIIRLVDNFSIAGVALVFRLNVCH